MSTRPKTTRKAVAAAPARKPTPSPQPRPEALPSPEMINVFEEALIRDGTADPKRAAGSPSARLLLKAWVNNIAYEKKVWVDVDILGRSGQPLRSESLTLGYVEAAGGCGDFFLVDAPVPPPTSPGRRGPAELLEYRLYYEVGGQIFTDGVPHRHQLHPM